MHRDTRDPAMLPLRKLEPKHPAVAMQDKYKIAQNFT